MRYARIQDGIVVEIITVPDGVDLDQVVHSEIASSCVKATDGVEEGQTYAGGAFGPVPVIPPAPPVVPLSVTAAQARIALSRAGKLDAVTAAVNAAGGETLIWFEYSTSWERQNPHVTDLGTGLKLSSSDIDGLFMEAASIAA